MSIVTQLSTIANITRHTHSHRSACYFLFVRAQACSHTQTTITNTTTARLDNKNNKNN